MSTDFAVWIRPKPKCFLGVKLVEEEFQEGRVLKRMKEIQSGRLMKCFRSRSFGKQLTFGGYVTT